MPGPDAVARVLTPGRVRDAGPRVDLPGMLRFLTAGESHGRALVVIVEGMPAGLLVTEEDIQRGLARRRLGFGRGPRMRFEADEVSLVGGIRHGRTLGSPSPSRSPTPSGPSGRRRCRPPRAALQGADPAPARPRRPGRHAQVRARRRPRRARAGLGPRDGGPGGRRHPGQAAAGQIGVDVLSHVVQLGPERAELGHPAHASRTSSRSTTPRCAAPTPRPRSGWWRRSRRRPRTATRSAGWPRSSPTACRSASGSHVHWDRQLDALLAQALMSIQAIKAVEIGEGSELAGLRGSEAHDAIRMADRADRTRPSDVAGCWAAATCATPTGPAASRAGCPPAPDRGPGRR